MPKLQKFFWHDELIEQNMNLTKNGCTNNFSFKCILKAHEAVLLYAELSILNKKQRKVTKCGVIFIYK